MANQVLVDMLRKGRGAWNAFRKTPEGSLIDLEHLAWTGAKWRSFDFTNGNLREAVFEKGEFQEAKFLDADLSRARFFLCIMRRANLRGAKLSGAAIVGTDLGGACLANAHAHALNAWNTRLALSNCDRADFSGASLRESDFTEAILTNADMSGAKLERVICCNTDLRGANLSETDLRGCSFFRATLDGADLTGAKLYGVNMTAWSITGVKCEYAFWGERGLTKRVDYQPGEFERLYGKMTSIELTYPGGVNMVEIVTLGTLIKYLEGQHPGTGISLRSIEETGGGAKVTLQFTDPRESDIAAIRDEVAAAHRSQLKLREREGDALKVERDLLRGIVERALSGGQNVNITGSPTNLIIAGGGASVHANQTTQGASEMLALVRDVLVHQHQAPAEEQQKLSEAAHAIEDELKSEKPKKSVLKACLSSLKEVATKVATTAGTKIVEENWHTWAQQLEHLIKSLS